MKTGKTTFRRVSLSLRDLLGREYVEAVCGARAFLVGENAQSWDKGLQPLVARDLATARVDFYPKDFEKRLLALLPRVGETCIPGFKRSCCGAGSADFEAHTKTAHAPVGALGYFRVGENGRLFLTTKCEHYHVPLGHGFPGYRLLEFARRLGVPNATHNNTRGHITRLLEEELVRTAAGIERSDRAALLRLLQSKRPAALNRVLNLETGSLAAEAALKMLLARFYKSQPDSPKPTYRDRVPVFLAIGDDAGGLTANYHGTTVLTQLLRGMWPDFGAAVERSNLLRVRSVRANDLDALQAAFDECDRHPLKIAGCFLELVLMNYGGRRLTESFVRRLFTLCKAHDVPTVVDEIQTGIWSPELYLFREYGVKPAAVVIGKGFPGGEYAASRVLFSAALDNLPQFGALVTNGQEELASLAYLIAMRWAEANADVTRAVGEHYELRLNDLATRHAAIIRCSVGRRHLAGVCFLDLAAVKRFVALLNDAGLDISAQTYKSGGPATALTKLPLIAGFEVADAVIAHMEAALRRMERDAKVQ